MFAYDETRRGDEFVLKWLELPANQISIEVPEHEMHEYDKDSTVERTELNSTRSISSSVLEYREIDGRDYHSDRWSATYWLPIDEKQLKMQRFINHAITILLGEELYLAPLKANIERVLDVGTGEGLWAIKFAKRHPLTEVLGTDLSPIQALEYPENVRFELEDCTREWTLNTTFDYVHLRGLAGNVRDWYHLFSEAYRYTRPGGFVESHEASFRFRREHKGIKAEGALARVGDMFKEAGDKTGCSFTVADDGTQKKSMGKAGFTIVGEKKLKMPIGNWSNDPRLRAAGSVALCALKQDLPGYLLYLKTQILGCDDTTAQVFLMEVRKQLKEDIMYVYIEHNVVVGQKPPSESG